jgi:hypothetical protein
MKYTITDSHSLTSNSPFTAEILAAKKLKVSNKLGEAVVEVNPDQGGPKQRFAKKGTGGALYKLLLGCSKANPIDVEIEVAE